MARIFGYHHLSLSITDLETSTRWYEEVLGLKVKADVQGEGFVRKRLGSADGAVLTLTQHDERSGDPFSERRTGMDHFALAVDEADIDAYKRRFEELKVTHSEVKREPGRPPSITLRDPDNIQLEIFGESPRTGG